MVTKKWRWCDACDLFSPSSGVAACVLGVAMGLAAASCSSPPTTAATQPETAREAASQQSEAVQEQTEAVQEQTEAATQQDAASDGPSEVATMNPTEAEAPTASADASKFAPVITNIRNAIATTMSDTWTTQVVDDSRPEEVCAGRAHVNVVVPAQASGAVRAKDQGAAVSVVARRYNSAQSAAEALDYVAVTSTTDCNPLAVTEGFEDFFVAESVDAAQLELVDDAQGWASYRRSIADPDDVQVAAYSASYRVGESLATITGRVEVGPDESPDDAVTRARQLQSTVVAPIVDVLQSAS